MGEVIGNELPAVVISHLRGGTVVFVATVGEDGMPNSAPFSWVVAKDSRTVRLGVNRGVATLHNIRHNGRVSISLMAGGHSVTMKGTGTVIKDNIEAAPLPTAVVEIRLHEVKDDAVIGRVDADHAPTRWTDRRRLLSDSTILAALRDA
ncbi:MAG: pyridoxamine 5'-phosphate oxidase family protein [Chloroflexota bacterium]